MKITFKYACVLSFLIFNYVLQSQNEAAKWFFGNGAELDFTTNPPAFINGVLGTTEGCTALSDASGNVLMYSNGLLVMNRLNAVMSNGSSIGGDQGSSQSSLIVKQPGNTNLYYIFTTRAFESPTHTLAYSIVDMNLSAGNGSVTVKNATLFANSSEKLTAVKHCNGTDLWIISHDRLSNTFRSYQLTATGVNSTPVISSVSAMDVGAGILKSSPSGRKLGMTNYTDPTYLVNGTPGPFSYGVYDFDNATGLVSNPLDLGTDIASYGCEFSPDETKFYAGTENGVIYQWNLCAGSGTAIAASRYLVYTAPNSGTLTAGIEAMQMAPDGKIYVGRASKKALGVINTPNLLANNCNFADTSQSIAPKVCTFGLPNFMPVFKPAIPSFTATVNSAISCNTATFNASPLVNCPYSGYISTMTWNFDDPNSGGANTTSLATVTHTYSAPGLYNVTLILYNQCSVAIDTLKQQVSILHIPITTASGFSLCAGKSLTLSAAGGFTNYQWSNGSTATSIAVTPTMTNSYTLTATDAYNCNYMSVQTVTLNPLPIITIAGNTFVCSGSAVTQTAGGAVYYTWTTGNTSTVVTFTPSTSIAYTVTGTDANGCKGSTASGISFIETPSVTVNSATVCMGNTTTLTAVASNQGQNISYTWQPGSGNGSTITVTGTILQIYTLIASISNCSAYATSTLTVIAPGVTISPSQTITPGSSITLQASGSDSYHWSPANYLNCVDCSSPVASPPGDIEYCVTAYEGSCTATACLTVAVGCASNGDFSLPNAFTPNGDHNNDEFCLHGWECTSNFNVKIYDRWGEKVFESEDPAFCWDGVYKGKLLGPAVFVYMLTAKKTDNEPLTKKGNITLLR